MIKMSTYCYESWRLPTYWHCKAETLQGPSFMAFYYVTALFIWCRLMCNKLNLSRNAVKRGLGRFSILVFGHTWFVFILDCNNTRLVAYYPSRSPTWPGISSRMVTTAASEVTIEICTRLQIVTKHIVIAMSMFLLHTKPCLASYRGWLLKGKVYLSVLSPWLPMSFLADLFCVPWVFQRTMPALQLYREHKSWTHTDTACRCELTMFCVLECKLWVV